LYQSAVICEVMTDDGSMARLSDLVKFAEEHAIKIFSVAQLVEYRRQNENLVRRVANAQVPTEFGDFECIAFESVVTNQHHLALVKGDLTGDPPPLVRMHSECLTGDVFGSLRCDCGEQLKKALQMIGEEGRGVVVYMRHHEGRGIGIVNKLRAYRLQDDEGLDTVDANLHLGFPPDRRDYGIGAQILVDLGLRKVRFLTNNPGKRGGIQGFGLEVVEQVPLVIHPNATNRKYLETKQQRMGHLLDLDTVPLPNGDTSHGDTSNGDAGHADLEAGRRAVKVED
jgi:3,4-dihydroxy 2-butanone 4-phosphate synthase/GTP cyclohydrolase II